MVVAFNINILLNLDKKKHPIIKSKLNYMRESALQIRKHFTKLRYYYPSAPLKVIN